MSQPPRPGAKRRALAAEQQTVERIHARVEELRVAADRLRREAEAGRTGSTFQAVYERDVTAFHHAVRASRYTFGDDEPLVFGRLDHATGEVFHIGRVAVLDAERNALLVDWRAPVAADFYRATPADPRSLARRRTLTCRGPEVIDLDDELLDLDAAERLGLQAVTGQGALLAALNRSRTGRMHDIVATIQADQDRIIRLPASGTVIVTGGPGTGKTVVALHRVAYLLYTHRDRFDRRGVLFVGPSNTFTRYIGNVLPSLGEDRAVLRSVAELAGQRLTVTGWDPPEVAEVKGRLAMAELCRRALQAAQPPLPATREFVFDGTAATVRRRDLRSARQRVWKRVRPVDIDGRGGYHGRRGDAEEALLATMWRRWRLARKRAGGEVPQARLGSGFDADLREDDLTVQLADELWPQLDAADVLARLADGRLDLAHLAEGLLSRADLATLQSVWGGSEHSGTFTVEDVALLDELDALLGPPPEPARPPEDSGIRLSVEQVEGVVTTPDVDDPGYRDFAHVVVDEAQDLSPMQWRMVARRGTHASWTIVGDLAQRSRVAEPATWDEIAALVGRRQVVREHLTINYRTPTEVMDLARAVLEEAGLDPEIAPRSVRATGEPPELLRADDAIAAAVHRALADAAERDGTVALVVPAEDVVAATARLEDALQRHGDPRRSDLADRVTVFDPRSVKGLEFDMVVIAHPDRIAAAALVGLHHLYIAVTRTTTQLTIVATADARVPGGALTDETIVAA